MSLHLLVADDDAHIRELLRYYLTKEGYVVHLASDGKEAIRILASTPCHLAIVDVMMPKLTGWEVCEQIRKEYDIPVILLTAKGELEDKAKGFKLGTDDYVVKPFEPEELLFRVKALLRRYKLDIDKVIELGNTVIDSLKYEVRIDDEQLILPLKEFQLLYHLASHPGRTFTREQLIEALWGIDFDGDSRTVDVHIKRLREKLSAKTTAFSIKTIRGLGYKLEANV
ncbi:MAG: response regulator transcription factor [Bacillaceae bacterium]